MSSLRQSNWRLWLPWPRDLPEDGRVRLFCFPYAGGGSWIFSRWPNFFEESCHVLPVVLPGREHRIQESPIENIAHIADKFCDDLESLLSDGPYGLFGHSFGGFLVFEIAKTVASRDLPPPLLVVISGCRGPGLPRTWNPIHHLPDNEFERTVETRFGPIPLPLRRDRQTLQIYLRILRADLKAVETYVPTGERSLPGHVLVCGGREDPFVPVEDLFAWANVTAGECAVEIFPGGHFYLRENARLFLSALKQHITRLVPSRRQP